MDEETLVRLLTEADGHPAAPTRRVLVLDHRGIEARAAFMHAVMLVNERRLAVARVSRANGRECIEFESGGRIDFRSAHSAGHRGMQADLVIVSPDVLFDARVMDDVDALLATRPRAELWVMAGVIDRAARGRALAGGR